MPRVSQAVAKITKQKIIDISLKIVILEGEKYLTFENIAKQARMSRSGINCHFKVKQDLLDAIRPILINRVKESLVFTSEKNFLTSWKNAIDNDASFNHLIGNLGSMISSKESIAGLLSLIEGEAEEKMNAIYTAIGYAIVNTKK